MEMIMAFKYTVNCFANYDIFGYDSCETAEEFRQEYATTPFLPTENPPYDWVTWYRSLDGFDSNLERQCIATEETFDAAQQTYSRSFYFDSEGSFERMRGIHNLGVQKLLNYISDDSDYYMNTEFRSRYYEKTYSFNADATKPADFDTNNIGVRPIGTIFYSPDD